CTSASAAAARAPPSRATSGNCRPARRTASSTKRCSRTSRSTGSPTRSCSASRSAAASCATRCAPSGRSTACCAGWRRAGSIPPTVATRSATPTRCRPAATCTASIRRAFRPARPGRRGGRRCNSSSTVIARSTGAFPRSSRSACGAPRRCGTSACSRHRCCTRWARGRSGTKAGASRASSRFRRPSWVVRASTR
ncbi:MAG: hypothetical protein AMXMBFR52_26530, partial [Burkholderiales bacterium]